MTGPLHPGWDDPRHCDADQTSTAYGFGAPEGRGCAHRSEPILLDLSTASIRRPGRYLAYLFQPIAAVGAATTYVWVRPVDDDDPAHAFEAPLTTVEEIVVAFGGLIARACVYARDDPETGRELPPNIEGHLFGYGGCRRSWDLASSLFAACLGAGG